MATIFKAKGKRKAKWFIGVGHGGNDSGAKGYVIEEDVVLNTALAEKDFLVAHGVEVCMSRIKDENDPVMEEVRECNQYNPNGANDCHANSGGGDGFEVFRSIIGTDSKKIAECINKQVIAIGQNSRGVKTRVAGSVDYYAFVRETYCPAVICEMGFVDNKADAAQFDELEEQRAFGIAYAKGVLDYLGISYSGSTGDVSGGGSTPLPTTKIPDVVYQTYTRGKGLLSNIRNCNGSGTDSYAGWEGYDILALYANTEGDKSVAGKLKFRAHRNGGGWFNWQYDREKDKNGENFAGDKKHSIDGFQMELIELPGFEVWYQAWTVEDGWLSPVTGYGAGADGYAGIYGHDIQKVRINIVKV